MSLENDLKSGRFLGLDSLEKMVRKAKAEQKDQKAFRKIVLARQSEEYNDPKANLRALAKGVKLIQHEWPELASLLATIILLTQKFTRTHEQAIAIIAKEVNKPIQFIRGKELEAVRRVMDALESSKIIQVA